ncbi:MAG: hypothetical protein ABS79_07795, partial [Planctomycetes bacterium SCN 63-9]
ESSPKASAVAGADKEIRAINDAYDQQRLQLERQRLESLARLAERQSPAAGAVTYEQLFRLAIANNLFIDAAKTAEIVVQKGSPSPTTLGLANFVKIIAECDRGEHEQALQTLRRVIDASDDAARNNAAKPTILTSEKIELCDLYYQRLIHSSKVDIAKQAFQLLKDRVRDPAMVEFVNNRLNRLNLVGAKAPAIRGTDLDGKPFDLADRKGKVTLVVFWASWCLPCASEIETLQQISEAYRSKGFQVVGINLDTLQDDGGKAERVLPNVRRFLIDYNVTWPTLLNGDGEKDYAKAYGVTAIPSNTLIARDGTVVQIDLVQKNLESTIALVTGE